MITFDYNASLLTSRIQAWQKASGLTFPQALKKQAGLLKQDLWRGAPPKNLAAAKKRAERDVRLHFAPIPPRIFKDGREKGKLRWLYAGKHHGGRFVLGVEPSDYREEISSAAMRKLQKKTREPNRYSYLGFRGKKGGNAFYVMKLNRTVVKKSRLASFIKEVKDSFGKQKAAWAVEIVKFGGKNPPQWIAKHLAKARGSNQAQLTGDRPFIRIISRAKGVESSASIKNVKRCLRKRMSAMQADMKLYLAGIKKKAGFA